MTGSGNDSTQPFAKTICSICYEDLKPNVEDLQAISICGHVFHERCIQQWFEYCSKGKKNCPICKQKCSALNVSRLYFQSVGESNDSNLSQKLQTHKEDSNELKLEVRRLEGRINVLISSLESQENDLNDISKKLCVCEELLKKESSLKNEALEKTKKISCLLNLKTDELQKSQERNMALAKELAELKLVSDLDLNEKEIVKLASLGTVRTSVDILSESLVVRNMLYKKLMEKYNTLGTRSRKDLQKAEEKLEELKKKIQKMKTAKEMKDNEDMSALKVSKKTKNSPNVLNGVDLTLNDTYTPQDTINEHNIDLRKTKRSRVSKNINESNNEDGISSYRKINNDATKVSISPKPSSYDSVPQPTKRATTDAAYSSKNVHETSEHDGVPCHDCTDDDDVVFLHENGQDKPLPNITKEASLPVFNCQQADLCHSAGVLGPDGTKRHPGTFCKRGQSKGSGASLMPTHASGEYITDGPDGRGGKMKVLKSPNPSSLNSRRPLISPKSGKFGAKASSSQTQGFLRIDHFYSKAGQ